MAAMTSLSLTIGLITYSRCLYLALFGWSTGGRTLLRSFSILSSSSILASSCV
jgi:hypothetical protein